MYKFNVFTGSLDYYQSSSTPSEYNAGNSGSSITIDWNNGTNQLVTLTANCTFTFINPVIGQHYELVLCEDATGGWTPTLPSSVHFASGTTPSWATNPRLVNRVSLYYDNTGYIAFGTVNLIDTRYPFTPMTIPSNVITLESDTNVTPSGSNASQWVDQSSNSYVASQSTGANQPLIVTGQLNGHQILRFNGTTSFFNFVTTNLFDTTKPYTLYVLLKLNVVPNASSYPAILFTPTSAGMIKIGFSGDASYSDVYHLANSTYANWKSGSLSLSTSGFHKLLITYNGSGISTLGNYGVSWDSTAGTPAAPGGTGFINNNSYIGTDPASASNYISCDLAAIYGFNGALNVGQQSQMSSYISQKWGL